MRFLIKNLIETKNLILVENKNLVENKDSIKKDIESIKRYFWFIDALVKSKLSYCKAFAANDNLKSECATEENKIIDPEGKTVFKSGD